MGYTFGVTLDKGFEAALAATRSGLTEQGFGVLTEIDFQATLKEKLDADIPPQTILGACRPALAHAAVQAEPSIGALLPCNVVVRALGEQKTRVEAMDPDLMVGLTGNDELTEVAQDARGRLAAAFDGLAARD